MNESPQNESARNGSPQPDGEGPVRKTGAMRGRWMLYTASAVLAVLAITLLAVGISRQEPAPPQAATASTVPGEPSNLPAGQENAEKKDNGQDHKDHEEHGASSAPPRGTVLTKSVPEQITIPSLGVDSTLEGLGLDGEQVMETPDDPDKAGWFTPGPTPGELGPAVIAGHVTWNDKPAVFFDLAKAKKGTRIEVGREDGKTAVFTVDRTLRYPKDDFPTLDVYRNLDHPGLRLITCSGTYDNTTHRYADNTVVYASLTSVR